jgi:pSer/pThr/pTyr-binding forkhead associated (FHA) protein/tetratricopeptide (TPR) repeat protein
MSGGTKTTPSKVSGDTPYLEQTAGAGWGRTFELSRKKLSIGRTTDNEIVLDSTSVSRVHAVLKQTAKGWFIEDNISKNGIWVNGIAIKKALLRPGDVVQIGEFVFRYCDPRVPSPMSHPEEVSRAGIPSQKTEVISTDAWDVGAESTPQKPPIEAPPPAPAPTSVSQSHVSQRSAPVPSPTMTQQPPVAQQPSPQMPSYTPPPTTYGRPRVHPPVRPIHLASFGKNHQEKLYLAIGLLGGLLVGTLLYMRTQKPSNPTPVVKNHTSDIQSPRTSQDAFREIADTTNTPEELEDGLPQYQRQKAAEQTPPVKPKPRHPEAQAILQANEEAKKPKIRPEELQLGVRSKKNRVASKDIGIYLEEGKAFLKDGDYESAALAFRFALVIDPNNATAKAGIASATSKRKHIDEGAVAKAREPKPKPKAEPKVDKQQPEKRAAVIKLLKTALESLKKRRYQDAIVNAEKARQIEIPDETAYLNEAKQIIDRSERRQKEEFEPFIDLARQKMAEGDYRGSILLCEEMLRTDPGYAPAKECMERSTAGLAASVGTKPEGVK